MRISAMTKRVLAVAGAASLIGVASVFTAPAASAQTCSSVEGYAKRFVDGATEYYETDRCGHDINRPVPPHPAPRPTPPAIDGPGDGCGYGILGDVMCQRTGADRTAPFEWNMNGSVHMPTSTIPTGTVTVGAPIPHGGASGGGNSGGTVIVGEVEVVSETNEK